MPLLHWTMHVTSINPRAKQSWWWPLRPLKTLWLTIYYLPCYEVCCHFLFFPLQYVISPPRTSWWRRQRMIPIPDGIDWEKKLHKMATDIIGFSGREVAKLAIAWQVSTSQISTTLVIHLLTYTQQITITLCYTVARWLCNIY